MDNTIEQIASILRNFWSEWREHEARCLRSPNKGKHLEAWRRRMVLPYYQLSDDEKRHDRETARAIIALFSDPGNPKQERVFPYQDSPNVDAVTLYDDMSLDVRTSDGIKVCIVQPCFIGDFREHIQDFPETDKEFLTKLYWEEIMPQWVSAGVLNGLSIK